MVGVLLAADEVAMAVVGTIVAGMIVAVILPQEVATAEVIEVGVEVTPRTSYSTPTSRDLILALHGIGLPLPGALFFSSIFEAADHVEGVYADKKSCRLKAERKKV